MRQREPKSLYTLVWEAKTFYDLISVITDHHKRSLLKKHGIPRANRQGVETSLRGHESDIKSLEARRQRYDEYQANKKVPAALRKQIAQLESEILRLEYAPPSFGGGSVRQRKKELAELLEQVDRLTNPPKPLSTLNKAFKIGKAYPRVSITRAYDGYVWDVLKGHCEELPRAKKGQRISFKIVAALPEKSEYLQLKERHFTKTLDALVDDAYSIVDELQKELEDAYENMPEGLRGSSVGEARAEAASELESISGDQPDVPQLVSSLRIVHYPSLRQSSRGDRADEAANMLRAAVKVVQKYLESGVKLKKAEAKDVAEFVEQLEDHASQIDGVEFPGMFG